MIAARPMDVAPEPRRWRVLARRLGLPVSAEPAALVLERDKRVVAQPWTDVRTIMVANTKGESGKTPLALTMAAAFSECRGGGVGFMDNDPTGSSAQRIQPPRGHSFTLDDVVDQLDWLERSGASRNDLLRFMRFQADGNFYGLVARTRATRRTSAGDVEMSAPTITREQFRRVWTLLQANFQPVILDAGNNDADDPWRAALEVTDQLVVPVRWAADHCSAATQMLLGLAESGYEHLAESAIIVSTWPPKELVDKQRMRSYSDQFKAWGNPILHLPPDPHIDSRTVIDWSRLLPATRAAAIHIAAEITRSLDRRS